MSLSRFRMCQTKLCTSLFPLIFPFGHRIFGSGGKSCKCCLSPISFILRESDLIAVIRTCQTGVTWDYHVRLWIISKQHISGEVGYYFETLLTINITSNLFRWHLDSAQQKDQTTFNNLQESVDLRDICTIYAETREKNILAVCGLTGKTMCESVCQINLWSSVHYWEVTWSIWVGRSNI